MSYTVQMPALGESVTEGTITRWLKQVGEQVQDDEPLLEVSTDKVDTEIPSPQAGTLQRIVAGEDDTVEVGGDLAVIDPGGAGDGAGLAAGGAQHREAGATSVQRSAPEPSAPQATAASSAADVGHQIFAPAGPNGSADAGTESA